MNNTIADTDITLEHSTSVEKSIQENVNHYYQDREQIERRLLQLDNEWDVEKIIELKVASLSIAGVLLGLKKDKRWFSLPVVASTFLISHSIFRWNPALPIMKLVGFRSRTEIDKEKYALKALRGDFNNIIPVPNAVWNAVNK